MEKRTGGYSLHEIHDIKTQGLLPQKLHLENVHFSRETTLCIIKISIRPTARKKVRGKRIFFICY